MADIRIGDRIAIVGSPLAPAYGYVWPSADPTEAELTRAFYSQPTEVLDDAPAAWVVTDAGETAVLVALSDMRPIPRATCDAHAPQGTGTCFEAYGHDLAGLSHAIRDSRGGSFYWPANPAAARASFDEIKIGAAA